MHRDPTAARAEQLAELAATADSLSRELAHRPVGSAIGLLAGRYRGRIALVSSFGTEAAVLLHLVAQADPAMPVLFVDTGKLFPETLAYRDGIVRRLGLRDVRSLGPDSAAVAAHDSFGGLWSLDPDACCALRKVRPLAAALVPFAIWLNGRRRAHGGDRADLPLVEVAEGRLKANPLARWDDADVTGYLREHALPAHPLAERGYASVGCTHCTSPIAAGEEVRAGRWRGTGKTECGIHTALTNSKSTRIA